MTRWWTVEGIWKLARIAIGSRLRLLEQRDDGLSVDVYDTSWGGIPSR